MTPEQMQAWRWEQELDERNRPLSDEELDALFPQDGYKVLHLVVLSSSCDAFLFLLLFQILTPPANYQPIRTPARKLTATPTPMGMSGFHFQMEENKVKVVESLQPTGANMPYMKMEDTQYFSKLLEDVDETQLGADEQREREIMRLLLKIKNGTPPMRKVRRRRKRRRK